MERQAQYVTHAGRTDTMMYQTAVVIDCIMRRTDDRAYRRNPGEQMWRTPVLVSRNSNIGIFLANNFPKDHRVYNYVHVLGFAGPPEAIQ